MQLQIAKLPSLALLVGMCVGCSTTLTPARVRESVVRIDTDDGYASGFFVQGHNKVYVATVHHGLGPGIVVSREVEVDDAKHYREYFKDVRIVAVDRKSDLALLELIDVPAARTPTLPLSTPHLDAAITSWGNAPSSLSSQGGVWWRVT